MENKFDVAIVGAGIAGLTAAKVLTEAGKNVLLIEKSDGVGGRVRTDEVDGFLLDRGFQVMLTAYPDCKEMLNYQKLNFKPFKPGAIILRENRMNIVADPFREPALFLKTIVSPVGSLKDKLMMLALRLKLESSSLEHIFAAEEKTTLTYLRDYGFSERFIQLFFKPFFSGIFLENALQTSSNMFKYVFKMFSEGNGALPAKGMGMISKQLAKNILPSHIKLNETISHIDGKVLISETGNEYFAHKIILATAADVLPKPYQHVAKTESNAAVTYYFKAKEIARADDHIALNAQPNDFSNNIAFVSKVAPGYAPEGQSLVSVNIKSHDLNHLPDEHQIKAELKKWYREADSWQFLKSYVIPYALPKDLTVKNNISPAEIRLNDHCYLCGDHLLNGSINAALKSGKIAAQAVLSE